MAEAAQVGAAAINAEADADFPGVLELTEEEEVFLPARGVKGPGGLLLSVPGHGEPSSQDLDNQFLHLAIRKQVSYRPMDGFAKYPRDFTHIYEAPIGHPDILKRRWKFNLTAAAVSATGIIVLLKKNHKSIVAKP